MTVFDAPDGSPDRFLPPESAEAAPFWEATRQRRLDLQHCRHCDRAIHFPRALCPHCHRQDLDWRTSPGTGSVHAVTIMTRPAHPSMNGRAPYAVAIVELDEDVRLLTNLVGPGALDAGVGDRVRLAWEPLSDGRHLPVFELDGTG